MNREKNCSCSYKWTKACDKRLTIELLHSSHVNSDNIAMWETQHNNAYYDCFKIQQCISGLFQDSDFAGDLEDSKSTSGGVLCIFGSHTFQEVGCARNKHQSHSSTEVEFILLMQVCAWTEFLRLIFLGFCD